MEPFGQFRNTILSIQPFDPESLEQFIGFFKTEWLKKGQHYIKSGDTVKKTAYIAKGIFHIYYIDFEGKELTQAFHSAQDFIVSRMLSGAKSLVNIQALNDCTLLTADFGKIRQLAFENHDIAKLFINILSGYFDKNQDREVMLRIQNATDNYRLFLKQHPGLIDKIPHYHIANYLRISPTHLSRIRKELSLNG